MKQNSFSRALACLGAVIGAGFASGREMVAFFSRYGSYAPWLSIIAAAAMALLCWLCMERRVEEWSCLYAGEPVWIRFGAKLCVMVLLILTGGAMLSAAGHVFKLCFEWEWAYAVGVAGTLLMAWQMGNNRLRAMSLLSAGLSMIFIAMVCLAMLIPRGEAIALEAEEKLGLPALNAVGYAGMNMTLAIGVTCKCSSERRNGLTAVWFGGMMLVLMLASNQLYQRHPEWMEGAFPIVQVMSGFGRLGFWLSASLIYLAVFTSLTAVLCALRSAVKSMCIGMGLPLVVSCIGFEGIVDGLYAPAGLLCLALVFMPLARRKILTSGNGWSRIMRTSAQQKGDPFDEL